MHVHAHLDCPLFDSFRVQQVAGMFDVSPEEACRNELTVTLPDMAEDWTIGAVVGPSGGGKTSVAKQAWPESFYQPGDWPRDKAVIDGFGEAPMKTITHTLAAVGFSSPPSWLRPYHVLSGGERFRCDLAKALLSEKPLIVFDEFTSVVDRTVAKFGSAAVAKALRKGRVKKRFVAVTCHYDVLPWLAPDWVLDMADGRLHRRRLRRLRIRLRLFRCRRDLWALFKRYHYLSRNLHKAAQCFVALWEDTPVAFVAVLPLRGFKRRKRISRIVVPPDFQGVGVGRRVTSAVAAWYRRRGFRMNLATSHPAMIMALRSDNAWRCVNLQKQGGSQRGDRSGFGRGRLVAGFEFVGEAGVARRSSFNRNAQRAARAHRSNR